MGHLCMTEGLLTTLIEFGVLLVLCIVRQCNVTLFGVNDIIDQSVQPWRTPNGEIDRPASR